MLSSAKCWNARYKDGYMPSSPSTFITNALALLRTYLVIDKHHLPLGLDLACGNGRHTILLAKHHFEVDAIDISHIALSHIQDKPHINAICADLDDITLPLRHYDVILISRFLSRRLFPSIKQALKPNAIIIIETYINLTDSQYNDKILQAGELENVFSAKEGFDILRHSIYKNKKHHLKASNTLSPYLVGFMAQYKPQKAYNIESTKS